MKIKVTTKHIEYGIRRSIYQCPVALAVRDAIGKRISVAAWPDDIRVGSELYPTPDEARKLMEMFDEGMTVMPFTFELPIEANQEAR